MASTVLMEASFSKEEGALMPAKSSVQRDERKSGQDGAQSGSAGECVYQKKVQTVGKRQGAASGAKKAGRAGKPTVPDEEAAEEGRSGGGTDSKYRTETSKKKRSPTRRVSEPQTLR